MKGSFEEVYHLLAGVPRGRVVTYGDLSCALQGRLSPLAVGWALHRSPPGVPWQRVVNAQGRCSTERPERQRALLEAEGIRFDSTGRLDLGRYRHRLDSARSGG